MARRRNKGLLDLLAELPWWISVVLAALVYVFLKFALPLIHFENPFIQAFSKVLPNLSGIFAFLFLVGAFISFLGSLRRKKLLSKIDKMESIRQLSWQEFELLVGEYFRRKGYIVHENGGGGADGGVDLVLTKANQTTIVQCKRWKNVQVGVSPIRELYGVMVAEKAAACVFVSSGRYTQEAESFANNKPIELINGETLYKLISEVRSAKNSANVPVSPVKTMNQASTVCPKCGSSMVERVAKRGANIGNKFYGCPKYPTCNGTIS